MSNVPGFEFFKKLADIVKNTSLPLFRHPLSIDNKDLNGFDPVTIADRETEIALREYIHRERPDDGILGEEFPTLEGLNNNLWVIDPIDGTRSFITGMPTWGSLVGLKTEGKAVAGIMAQPFTREIYYSCKLVDKATMMTTAPELFDGQIRNRFQELSQKVRLTRYSADCYAFAMLASGFVDLVVETDLKPYDITALIPIVEQAGGIIRQWNGKKAEDAGNIIASATPELLEAALSILND